MIKLRKWLKDRDAWLMVFLPVIVVFIVYLLTCDAKIQDSNMWYYSLSAIVQSAAAIMAIGGSFFTFKMLGVNKELNDYRERIITFFSIVQNVKKSSFYHLSNQKLLSQFKETKSNFQPDSNLVDMFLFYEGRSLGGNLQKEALDNWERIISDYMEVKADTLGFLKESTKLIGSTIVLSIVFLSGSELFYNSVPYLFLSIATLLFIVSVYYIATRIIRIVA